MRFRRWPTLAPVRSVPSTSVEELVWINNALAEVIRGPDAIEDWELHTRIRGDRDEVALPQRMHDEVVALRGLQRTLCGSSG